MLHGLPLSMLSAVDSLLILNENIFFDSNVSRKFPFLFLVFYSYKVGID